MDVERLTDDALDRLPRVQRRERVLEDDLRLSAQLPPHLAAPAAGDVLPVKDDGSGGGQRQPNDEPAQGGLAAARLSHQPDGLTGSNLETDAVDGLHHPRLLPAQPASPGATNREVLDEVPDLKQALGLRHSAHSGRAVARRGAPRVAAVRKSAARPGTAAGTDNRGDGGQDRAPSPGSWQAAARNA